jgi:biopolymer transport protein ExbB/TolQ
MNDVIARALLFVSDALLVPDVIGLALMFFVTLVWIGGLLREAWERRTWVAELRASAARRRAGEASARPARTRGLVARALADERPANVVLEDVQARMLHALERFAIGIRLGPMLGLAGTLIPLGPALMGFSRGEMDVLASNLVIVFAATVVGLFIAAMCWLVQHARRRWYRMDLLDLRALLA